MYCLTRVSFPFFYTSVVRVYSTATQYWSYGAKEYVVNVSMCVSLVLYSWTGLGVFYPPYISLGCVLSFTILPQTSWSQLEHDNLGKKHKSIFYRVLKTI